MQSREFSLDNLINAAGLLKLAQHFAHTEGTCLLYSGTSYATAQYSYLFLFPYDVIEIHGEFKKRSQLGRNDIFTQEGNPWEAMKILGPDIGQGNSQFPEWVGFFSYEMGAFADRDVVIAHQQSKTPEAYWQRCAITLKFDHSKGNSVIRLIDTHKHSMEDGHNKWINLLSTKEGWEQLLKMQPMDESKYPGLILNNISDTYKSYIDKIEKAKACIKSGDIYQINLSQEWEFLGEHDPFDLFNRLSALNPAPFSAYLSTKDFALISSSPERFLQKKNEILETRPIKGTAPRGRNSEEDNEFRSHLLASEKERSELMMITDLMRNDLAKISVNGSVRVPLLCGCETYQNVFHLHSIVRSIPIPSMNSIEIVRSCFPGGSISGCPKIRAMELIGELEGRPRGIYTGSIGYFSENGDFDMNIAIRTIISTKKKVNVQLGGGIVYDSNPQKEYEETYHKGKSIFEILSSGPIQKISINKIS